MLWYPGLCPQVVARHYISGIQPGIEQKQVFVEQLRLHQIGQPQARRGRELQVPDAPEGQPRVDKRLGYVHAVKVERLVAAVGVGQLVAAGQQVEQHPGG